MRPSDTPHIKASILSAGVPLLLGFGVSCTQLDDEPVDVPSRSTPAVEAKKAPTLTVSSAFVFIPKWEGATGFSKGQKYVIQGDMFNENRSNLSKAGRIVGLPFDGSPPVVFELVEASLTTEHVEVTTAGRDGQRFQGEETHLWLAYNGSKSAWHDLSQSRLMADLNPAHKPFGEEEHALSVAIDFDGDDKIDYAEFSHHCKAEGAPYPLDEAGRTEWESKHGPVDWDYTCTNVHSIHAGQWQKEARKTPM